MIAEEFAREEIVRLGALLHRNELVHGAEGNLSARVGRERIIVTPAGLPKESLHPAQLLAVTAAGELADRQTPAAARLRPSTELPMHLGCYRQRTDVHAVVHAHPPNLVAWSMASEALPAARFPNLGVTAVAERSASAHHRAIAALIGQHDAILLRGHGSLTVARDLATAYTLLAALERAATGAHPS